MVIKKNPYPDQGNAGEVGRKKIWILHWVLLQFQEKLHGGTVGLSRLNFRSRIPGNTIDHPKAATQSLRNGRGSDGCNLWREVPPDGTEFHFFP